MHRKSLLCVHLVLVVISQGAGCADARAQPVDLLITEGTIVTMDPDRRVLEAGALAIRDNVISGVYPAGAEVPEAARTISAKGHLVIPGLVNTHGHIAMTLLRGIADDLGLLEWLQDYIFPVESKNVSPEFVYWGSKLANVEMIRSGTTTFTDMYFFEEEVARATEEVGLRGVLGQTIIGFPAPDHDSPDKALRAAEKLLETYRDHPRIHASVAPHALYTTELEVIQKAHRLARRFDAVFQIHAVEPPEENDQMLEKLGKRTIPALAEAGILTPKTILAHAIWLSDEDMRLIANGGAGVSHNPESNMKTASGLARITELISSSVPVGLGTDGAASNNNLDMFEEMDSAAKIQKLVGKDPRLAPAKLIFSLATIGGAKALGLDEIIGSLEPGKRADIVLIDMNKPELQPMYNVYSHLVYAVKGSHVTTVIVEGEILNVEPRDSHGRRR